MDTETGQGNADIPAKGSIRCKNAVLGLEIRKTGLSSSPLASSGHEAGRV